MRSLLFAALAALSLSACSALTPADNTAIGASAIAVAQTTPGQLFCARETADGPLVVALVDAASALVPGAGPVAILATGATKAFVDAACAQAGGVAVSPPANPAQAPAVAIVPPAAS